MYKIAIPPYNSPKYQGGFCYVRLLTKRKYECKQCQKEYAKSQQLHKRNMSPDYRPILLRSKHGLCEETCPRDKSMS